MTREEILKEFRVENGTIRQFHLREDTGFVHAWLD